MLSYPNRNFLQIKRKKKIVEFLNENNFFQHGWETGKDDN